MRGGAWRPGERRWRQGAAMTNTNQVPGPALYQAHVSRIDKISEPAEVSP